MAKSGRKDRKAQAPNEGLLRKLVSHSQWQAIEPELRIQRIKNSVGAEHLFPLFPRLFPKRAALDRIYGKAFPKRLSEVFSFAPAYAPAGPLNEVLWAVCRCLQYGQELGRFVSLKERFERSLLNDSKEECSELLTSAEQQFGYSLWLVENKLSTTLNWLGIEEARRLGQSFQDELRGSWLRYVIFSFISRRIEATGVKDHLKSELDRVIDYAKNPILGSYLTAKIFELPTIRTKDVPATLHFESYASLIDLYEVVIAVLLSAATDQAVPSAALDTLEKPLLALYKRTADRRLIGILRGLGISGIEILVGDDNRAALLEGYSRGEYRTVVDAAQEYLKAQPDDTAIQVLRLRAATRLGQLEITESGVLRDVNERLYKILEFGQNTYSAAYDLLSIFDRYYSHAWAQYLRVIVLYELRREQADFPPDWLRDIYVRDPLTSPFSAISANGGMKAAILGDPSLRAKFPHTWAVYDLVTGGDAKSAYPVEVAREHCYLARHHLAFGDVEKALHHLEWLVANSYGEAQLRAAGGAALAHLKLGAVLEASEAIVRAAIRNPHVPSILPIEDVAKALEDPKTWPNSLAIPLFFELCVTYWDDGKFPHLRYAFERFQESNKIQAPGDLLSRADEFDRSLVTEYLRRVWRPEVMRQTVLYQGTREIEEARIKVCRVLAEADSVNSASYLEEIKQRVKQLEITKATTLMEQSKVYVDIEAIRRSLRTKLNDSYARYKTASQTPGARRDQNVLYSIAKALTNDTDSPSSETSISLFLAKLHILEGDAGLGSEADVQFEALFSEVTNEFLRGAHGLNAYLSTRIRHGTLVNTLRKPIADERLVTSREEGKATYVRNQFWKGYQEADPEHAAQWESILDALDRFSAEFDAVVEYIRDNLIQIKIVHELKDTGENNEALFNYHSSNLERIYVQQLDYNFANMDEFVDRCIDILWEKTDANLLNVQHILNTEIREQLMQPFTNLANRVNEVSSGVRDVDALLNAIGRARTATQTKLGLVISWFKRSEVYDRQDYAPEFPFNIAVNMVKNTISAAANWSSISVKTDASGSLMPGRTLDGMVYVFYGLLENAILRSGVEADKLLLDAELTLSNGVFTARVCNTVAPEKLTPKEREKVEKLRESLSQNESPRRAQLEQRSGLHKIWLTINAPIYKEPTLTFYHLDSTFVVEFAYKLEASTDERSNN